MSRNKYDLIVLAWTTWFTFGFAYDQLIRPVHVYAALIKDMRNYFDNTCVILLHSNPDPIETQGLVEGDRLLFLQRYLSSLHIRTVVMDFQLFKTRIGHSYYHIKRPLFVLLNDHEDTRDEFANISTWIVMSYPTWLVFFRNETTFADFFFEIYVPFDCKFMVAQNNNSSREIITEVYQVDRRKELRSTHFGVWNVDKGLKGPTRGLFLRRNNLFGQNIRITSVHDPPVSSFYRNEQNEITKINGFFGEVILLLKEAMNCTFTYKEAKTWGMCLSNGTCTGAIGMLMTNDVDFAATEFLMTSDRLEVISFTTPIYTTKYRTYIKKPASMDVKWDAYTAPFSGNIWNAIIFFIIIMSGSIILVQKLFAFLLVHPQNKARPSARFTETLFFVTGAFCSQGIEHSTLDPVRLVHFVIHITAVVVLAAYSASLISFLALQKFIMPFTTMDGLLKDGTYRFGVVSDSADFSFFQNTKDKLMHILFHKLLMKETNLPTNYLDGLEQVCKENKYAFMVLDNMAAILQQEVSCELEPLDAIMQSTIAMALQSNSPYRDLINTNILLLRDSGILQRLLQTHWSAHLKTMKTSWKSVEIGDIVPLLLFMLAALLISCTVCIIEHIFYKYFSKRIKLNVNRPRRLKM